jgi:hypothetical protein
VLVFALLVGANFADRFSLDSLEWTGKPQR